MWLHVGIVGSEQLFDPCYRQFFNHVHVFAATVVALAGITFGVLIGKYRALSLHHQGAGMVL